MDARYVYIRWSLGCYEMGQHETRAFGRCKRDSRLQGTTADGWIQKLYAIRATNRRNQMILLFCRQPTTIGKLLDNCVDCRAYKHDWRFRRPMSNTLTVQEFHPFRTECGFRPLPNKIEPTVSYFNLQCV